MKKFKLEIEIGNDALLTGTDLALTLERVARVITLITDAKTAIAVGVIRDLNGNKVGHWGLS